VTPVLQVISTGGCFGTASENVIFTGSFLKKPPVEIAFPLAVFLIKPLVEIHFLLAVFFIRPPMVLLTTFFKFSNKTKFYIFTHKHKYIYIYMDEVREALAFHYRKPW
jgi:hypothetical protein